MRSTPRPGDGPAHREHVAQPPAALRPTPPGSAPRARRRRPARIDRESTTASADGRSTKTVNSCSVGCRDSASSNCRREPAESPAIGKAASVDSDSHGKLAMVRIRSGFRQSFRRLAGYLRSRPPATKTGEPTEPTPAAESIGRRIGAARWRSLRTASLAAAAQEPERLGDHDREPAAAVIDQVKRQGGGGEDQSLCGGPGTQRTPRFKQHDRRQCRSPESRPGPGNHDAERAGQKRQPGEGHARLLAELDVQVGLDRAGSA